MRKVGPGAVIFMYVALSVTAATGAHAQTTGFAPADQREFDDRFVGRRALDPDLNEYLEFLPNRRVIASNSDIGRVGGRYAYNRTGANRGTITADYDPGYRCTAEFTFNSRNDGTYREIGNICYGGYRWRLVNRDGTPVDSEPDFGSQDIADQRYVQNQAITPLTLPQASSGDAPLTYDIQPALPAGLTFNSGTRVLSGTPTAVSASRTYTYTATDADGDTASLTFTLTVQARIEVPDDAAYLIPLFTPASAGQQGFARIINRSDSSGTVRIWGIDDSGQEYGPIDFSLNALATAHFNSQDLEAGNASKGLSGGLGEGQGNWRLELDTELDIEVSAYIRTVDGFLTSMHDVARTLDDGRHHVPFFNPGSNRDQRSQLRLINLGGESVQVTIEGHDDKGDAAPGGEVRLTLGAGEADLLGAEDLETGGSGFSGKLGDGHGKWQLFVTADGPIWVMSLLQSPTGHLTNLSLSGLREQDGPPSPPEALASFRKFHVIAHDLSEAGDHDAECRTQLGRGFRLADWNDIVSYHEDGGSLTDFIAGLKMAPPGRAPMPPDELGNGYRISRDGRPIWSGRRHYFVARHDHDRPSFFLAHAHIDNYHLSLGSWYGTGGHALCYGESSA